MVNRRISSDLKECVLRLWELGWDQDMILESLCVSCASIFRWRKIFSEHNSVNKPRSPLIGRPRLIIRAVMTAIKQVYNNESEAYLDELVWWLAIQHDIVISRSALQSNLEDAGLTSKLLHKIASERDEELRADFLVMVREHSAGQGHEFLYSLLATITTDGYIACRAVVGSFDSIEFYDFVAEQVIPEMNAYPGHHSILVLDNCQIHHNVALVNAAGC
ncbi:hypothetical protein L208DRAFT_1368958 [Tricholoma matsutake]|nr:hypothetical protein L208DRAFT_1368958 [Tricholoma matsutake 945]